MFLVPCLSYLQIVPYVNSVRIISMLDSSSIFLRLIIILCNLTSICHSFLPSWVHRWMQYFIFSAGPSSVFKSVDFNFQLWFFEHNYKQLWTLSLIIQAWYVSIIDKDRSSPSLANTARVPTILNEFKILLPLKNSCFFGFACTTEVGQQMPSPMNRSRYIHPHTWHAAMNRRARLLCLQNVTETLRLTLSRSQ